MNNQNDMILSVVKTRTKQCKMFHFKHAVYLLKLLYLNKVGKNNLQYQANVWTQ